MKNFVIKLILLFFVISSFTCFAKDKYKKANGENKIEMAELISETSGTPEAKAFLDIMYSSVDLSPKGFKLNAKKKDFVKKGLDVYYYYALKDSLEETYKTLSNGFSVPELPNVDMVQAYIETFNKQKEDFYSSLK